MARPVKKNADYFAHPNDLRNDRRIKALRTAHGITGYAVYLMLLEAITAADYFRLHYNVLEIELLAGDFDHDSKEINVIIEYLVKLNLLAIDRANCLYSPMLEDSMQVLLDYRSRQRDKKRRLSKSNVSVGENTVLPIENHKLNSEPPVFPSSNKVLPTEHNSSGSKSSISPPSNHLSESENSVLPLENRVSNIPNTQSEGKESKVNRSKSIKEKTVKESLPRKQGENFYKTQPAAIGQTGQTQKENIAETELFNNCKTLFLARASGYYFEGKDGRALKSLITKVIAVNGGSDNIEEVTESFDLFLENLPKYWRTKKFTLPLINSNFNEILNEILTSNGASAVESVNSKFGRHNTGELAKRGRAFGR